MENMIDITLLKFHPLNSKIYGEEDIKELAEKIKKSGWIKPLLINQNNIVISGHRRLKACLSLGIKEVPFERKEFKNEQEELQRLLLENEYREKTTYQKIQEGKMWEKIYKAQAKERQAAIGSKNLGLNVENLPPLEQGKTRDVVAEKIDIGSGKTYEAAKKVVNEIDKLKEQGNKKDAEFVKATLNESVNGAKNILKTDLAKVDEGLKDKVISKEITAKEAVKEIKKQVEPKVDNSVKKEEMKVCSKCGQEKSIDKEKIRGIDINAVLQDVKHTDKNINIVDGKSMAVEISRNINMFAQNLSKYVEMEKQFEDMQNEDKKKITDSIASIEEVINKIKEFMY